MIGKHEKTVLIVDGSATMLLYHGILLKRMQYAVLTASRPKEALKLLEETTPALIITSTLFPDRDGFEFVRAISKPRTKPIPIIVLTAEEDPRVKSAYLDCGCTAYLIKSPDPGPLYHAIQAAIEATPRRNIRIATLLKTAIGDADGRDDEERIEYATMISEKGVYVRTLSPEVKDSLVPIRIYIKDREIRAKALVLYTKSIGQGPFKEPGMGLKFIQISEEDQTYLRAFIHEQLTSDIAVDPKHDD